MFLIEYYDGEFIDAEKINYIQINASGVRFTLSGDVESLYEVDNGMAGVFINNLQAINDNPCGLEAKLKELQEDN